MKKRKTAILLAVALTVSCMNGMMVPTNAADFSAETEAVAEEMAEDEIAAEAEEDTADVFSTEESDVQIEEPETENGDIDVAVDDEAEEAGTDESDVIVEAETEEADFLDEISGEVNEAEAAEAGVNNTVGTASTLKINTLYKDNLVNSKDVNWYKFSVSKAGNLSLTFKHDYIENGNAYWKTSIYNSSMEEMSWNSYTGSKMAQTTERFGIPAGTYYIKVYSEFYYSALTYNIKINYTESMVWETEVNDSYSQTDVLTVNQTYYGALQTNKDVDWYRFTVPKAGKISFTFKHDYIESGNIYWKVNIYDSSMNELTYYNFQGNTISDARNSFGVPAGTYYIKMYSEFYHSAFTYNMKINYTDSTVWETEVNDTYAQADSAKLGQSMIGSLQRNKDVDWYKFTVSKSSYISFLFNHTCIKDNGNIFWKATVYNARNMNEVDTYSFSGDKSYSYNRRWLAAGTYYVKVYNAFYYSDLLYSFQFNVYTPPVSLSRTKITTGSSVYTGGYVRPTVKVKYGSITLTNGKDYTVSYSKASKAGSTVTIKISGKGKYTGTVTRKVKIARKSVSQLTVKGVPSVKKHTGKSIKPGISVYYGRKKLKSGRDYTVSYGQNKKKGKGTIAITGKGNYSGTVKKYFTIK